MTMLYQRTFATKLVTTKKPNSLGLNFEHLNSLGKNHKRKEMLNYYLNCVKNGYIPKLYDLKALYLSFSRRATAKEWDELLLKVNYKNDRSLIPYIFGGHARLGNHKEFTLVENEMKALGWKHTDLSNYEILYSYLNSGQYQNCLLFGEGINKQSVRTMTPMMLACIHLKNIDAYNRLLNQIKSLNLKFEIRQYNELISVLSKKKMYKEVDVLLKQMKNCDVKGDIIFYSSLVTFYFQQSDFEGVKNVLQEMKRLSVEPKIEFYGNLLDKYIQHNKNGSMSKEIESLLKDMKDCDVKGNIIFYSSLVTLYFQQSDFEGVKNVLQEMKRLSVEPNIEFYNNLLSKYIHHNKNGIMSKEIESLVKDMKDRDVKGDSIFYSSLVTLYFQQSDFEGVKNVLQEMKRHLVEPKIEFYSNLLSKYSESGNQTEFENTLQTINNSDCIPDEVTVRILLDVIGKKGWGKDIDIDKLAIKYRILIDNKNLCPSNFVRAYSHQKHDAKAKKFWFKYCKSHDLYQSPMAVSIAIDSAGYANDHEWLQDITRNLNFNNLDQNNINSLIEASCRLKLYEEAIGCVKYFMAMFDEFEDFHKTIGTIRSGFESCEDKSLKEEVSMLMKKLHQKNLKSIF